MHPEQARLEQQIAGAHRKLWLAQSSANILDMYGLSEDLQALLKWLEDVQEDLLKSRGTRTPTRLSGQLRIPVVG